jgi:hypothetical protein
MNRWSISAGAGLLTGFCPGLLECLHFSNHQIQANNAILDYFMVQIQNFLGRVFAFGEWWSGPTSANQQGQNTAFTWHALQTPQTPDITRQRELPNTLHCKSLIRGEGSCLESKTEKGSYFSYANHPRQYAN